MRIRLLRNATLLLETGGATVLVDPMLGPRGTFLPFAYLRGRIRRNPLVDLPDGSTPWLEQVTHALITHCRRGHLDHLDHDGMALLRRRGIPVVCAESDARWLERRGLRAQPVKVGFAAAFLGGSVEAVPATHGRGIVARAMGCGHGFFIQAPGEPTVYLTGDTVLTAEVKALVRERRPKIIITPAGAARLDFGAPILMPVDEVIELIRMAPGRVMAVHLDALDHCETTRAGLTARLLAEGLSDRVDIPADGQVIDFGEADAGLQSSGQLDRIRR